MLTFNAIGLLPTDEIKVELYSIEITADELRRVFRSEGRDATIHHPQMPSHSRFDVTLGSPPAIRGVNTLRVTWVGSSAGAEEGSIVIPEIEVLVHSVVADSK